MLQPQRLQGLSCPKTLVTLRKKSFKEETKKPPYLGQTGSPHRAAEGNQNTGESIKTDDWHLTALPFSRGEARGEGTEHREAEA